MLIFSRYCIKVAKFAAFRGKAQEFTVVVNFVNLLNPAMAAKNLQP